MTQYERIVDYINEFGSISPMEAYEHLGITKLSTRIGEMERAGLPIEKQNEQGINRFGDKVHYMRYFLRVEV